jgi:asparagine synthase (glutamine-hydrolysing)
LYVDLFTYLSGDILTLTDRMSMAHSLEVRVPFLNRRFVEFVFSLPSRLKVRGLQTKALWRLTLKGHLPPAILKRRKQGFGVPIRHWFRGEKALALEDMVTRSPYFRPETVATLFSEHRSGTMDHSSRLWALVIFEYWRQAHHL